MNPRHARKPIEIKNVILITAVGAALVAGLAAMIYWFALTRNAAGPYRYVSTFVGQNGEFGEPFGIAVRGDAIFVSDGQNDKIWRIEGGSTTVFAEGLDTPSGLAFDTDGNLLVADTGSQTIKSINSKGVVAIVASSCAGTDHEILETGVAEHATLNGPIAVAVGPDGKVFFADSYNDRICVVENGRVTTLAGGATGYLDGSGSTARFNTPTGLAIWNDKLLVADTGNHRIRVVEPDGRVWTLVGNDDGGLQDGPLSTATLVQPTAIAVAGDVIYIADGNAVRRIDTSPVASMRTISNDVRGVADGDVASARFNRPSGLAIYAGGDLLVADSDNRLLRRMSATNTGPSITREQIDAMKDSPAEFRGRAPGRWPFDPPERPRDVAGTLGELRGEVGTSEQLWFHNGLDIAGGYGETARFIRDEKVLLPIAAQNFGTLRELLRLPSIGYIHICLGRSADEKPFGDGRFQFLRDEAGRLAAVRVARGTRFRAGEAIGTLNAMNHVHLITGRMGAEMNALDALDLPGLADTRPPVIEAVRLTHENGQPVETSRTDPRIRLTQKARIIVRAYDQMDGGSDRRRLGLYRLGYQVARSDGTPATEQRWTISFGRMPSNDAVTLVYAPGSRSGARVETVFDYILTNVVNGDEAREDFLDVAALDPGSYILRVMAEDRFENRTAKDIQFEVMR